MEKRFRGKRPHPDMQEEFLTEPTEEKGKASVRKLVANRGMHEKVG